MYLKLIINICLLMVLTGCAGTKSRNLCACDTMPKANQDIINQEEIIINLDGIKSSSQEVPDPSALPKPKLPKNHYFINSDQMIKVKISERGYTRFFLEGERIVDVFFYPQENLKIKIHDEGFLIVVPSLKEEINENESNSSEEKTYLTIVGDSGTTQDLILDFTGENPAPVKLLKSNPENTQE